MAHFAAWLCTLHALAMWVIVLALLQRLLLHGEPILPTVTEEVCEPVRAAIFFCDCVVLSTGVVSAFVHVGSDGKIAHVEAGSATHASAYALTHGLPMEDLTGFALSPGLIDAHVHISAVGGRGWEGYKSATQAAAAGGVTTIISMPLNSLPPTTSIAALELELEHAEGLAVDVGIWAGVVPSSLSQGSLAPLLSDVRVLGLKAFLSPLPSTAGYEALDVEQLTAAAAVAAAEEVPLLVHCELFDEEEMAALIAAARSTPAASRKFNTFLSTRPPEMERRAISALSVVAVTRICGPRLTLRLSGSAAAEGVKW